MNNEQLQKQVASCRGELIAARRWLHQHAELSFLEKETSAYLYEQLSHIPGLTLSRPTPTSVMAVLFTGRKGPVIAIRADIDALPMRETNPLPYVSLNPAAMHSCGHDAHAAILLFAAKLLAQNVDQLCGELRFIFQHAEEVPPGGAVEVIRAGVLEGVAEVYGLHATSTLQTGEFGVKSGVLTSCTDRFTLTVHGKGGHSSMPYECIDPILIGAQIILALQGIITRRMNARDTIVLSVCQVEAGTAYNIIPDDMVLTGSIRTFKPEVKAQMRKLIGEVSAGIAAAHGATLGYEYADGYGSIYNDPALTAMAERVIADAFGAQAIRHIEPMIPGDDFSYYHENCPGFFVELGAASEQKGIGMPHHNPAYQLDEDALSVGLHYTAALLLNRMAKE